MTTMQWKSNVHIYLYIQVLARATSLERQEQGSKSTTRDYKSIGSKKHKKKSIKIDMHNIRRLGAQARRLKQFSGTTDGLNQTSGNCTQTSDLLLYIYI